MGVVFHKLQLSLKKDDFTETEFGNKTDFISPYNYNIFLW